MTLLELATLGDADDFASLLLSVGAGGKADEALKALKSSSKAAKSSELTPLMWAGSLWIGERVFSRPTSKDARRLHAS